MDFSPACQGKCPWEASGDMFAMAFTPCLSKKSLFSETPKKTAVRPRRVIFVQNPIENARKLDRKDIF